MSVARYLLVLGRSVSGVSRPRWPGAGREAQSATVRWVAWRLLGANHRELARSAEVFADPAECRAAIAEVVVAITGGTGMCETEPVGGGWMWSLVAGGHRLAVSSRGYQRLPECRNNVGLFLAAAPGATVALVMPRLLAQRGDWESLDVPAG